MDEKEVNKKDIEDHTCLNNIDWEAEGEMKIDGSGNPYHVGYCRICGKEFHEVFEKKGIWDVEKEEYVIS